MFKLFQMTQATMIIRQTSELVPLMSALHSRTFRTSCCLHELRKMARVKIVDNSVLGRDSLLKGRQPRIIQVYNGPQLGRLGDKVLVSVCGEKKKGYIVGCVQKQKANVPRFDTNNVVLVEDTGLPTGTRIRVPIPSCLRGKEGDFTKILSIATKFV
ncbi:RM14-like protein [Mya arenaria]|uniref:Large ribosomal subunit protein uL14m n=1 Tax=Mya arenaria TaxID=6604 RepID=A0ABY7FG77_MYAAR|nr:RM14-like protein [Mya arenaria]